MDVIPRGCFNMMNKELQNIEEWLNVNKLSLNVRKTRFMVSFSSRRFVPVVSNLVINNSPITRIYTAKFSSVFIDVRLTWKNHIQHIKSKISRGLGVLFKARQVLNSATLLTLYYTFIYPYISYCIEIWGSAAIIHIASVERWASVGPALGRRCAGASYLLACWCIISDENSIQQKKGT